MPYTGTPLHTGLHMAECTGVAPTGSSRDTMTMHTGVWPCKQLNRQDLGRQDSAAHWAECDLATPQDDSVLRGPHVANLNQ